MDYEKAHKEALEKATEWEKKYILTNTISPDSTMAKEFKEIFPELAESEDERIRKEMIKAISEIEPDKTYLRLSQEEKDAWIAYLEKQKENIEKEYVFRPLAGTDINNAALQAIRRANEGDRLVLAFNGAYIPVRKGCNANKIVDIYEAFIKKQKEQKPVDDKAFEEWIDDWWKHNKVNNPDSYDKGDEIQFDEQGFKNFCRGIKNMYQQKLAEWSEEGENVIETLIRELRLNAQFEFAVRNLGLDYVQTLTVLDKCRRLCPRPSWKPSEEQIYSLGIVVKGYDECTVGSVGYNLKELYEQLKKLYKL